jgi:hypothetical protein
MKSHADGPTAATADTKTAIISSYTMPTGGMVRAIRLSFYQGVIDKSCSGILTFETDRQKGPFEYAVGGQMGITTTSGATGPNVSTEIIPVAIQVSQGEQVTISLTMSEALEECCVSFQWS